MGDLPLRTPTHRRFGGPLPRQLPNAPHAHPGPELLPLTSEGCPSEVSCRISRNFFRLSVCPGQVAYVLLTRAPVASIQVQALEPAAPRLACVKPVASVHPEPGSNSSLLYLVFFLFRREIRIPETALIARPDRFLQLSSLQKLTETLICPSVGGAGCLRLRAAGRLFVLVLLQCIVNLSMFSCAPVARAAFAAEPKKLCKVTANF